MYCELNEIKKKKNGSFWQAAKLCKIDPKRGRGFFVQVIRVNMY